MSPLEGRKSSQNTSEWFAKESGIPEQGSEHDLRGISDSFANHSDVFRSLFRDPWELTSAFCFCADLQERWLLNPWAAEGWFWSLKGIDPWGTQPKWIKEEWAASLGREANKTIYISMSFHWHEDKLPWSLCKDSPRSILSLGDRVSFGVTTHHISKLPWSQLPVGSHLVLLLLPHVSLMEMQFL